MPAPVRRFPLPGVLAVLALVAVSGCGSRVSSPSLAPVETPTATPSEALESEPVETEGPPSLGAGDVSQTVVEWGRIWDAIPPAFPIYPGSTPTTDIGAPASAQFVVPASVAAATAWTKAALDATGLRTTVSGPLEDGSMNLDSVGPAGCAALTTIAPAGDMTTMTILYGAACPFP